MYAMLRIVQMRNEDRKKGAEHSGMEWNGRLSEDCILCKTEKFDNVLGAIIVFLPFDIVETEQNTHAHQILPAKNTYRQSGSMKSKSKWKRK